jgi:hypothetical protein
MCATFFQIIETAFDEGFVAEESGTIAGVLNSISNMVHTLDQIVEDLVPLLPDEFNVMVLFQEKANRKIKSDIKTFYSQNKNTLNNRDLLTMLSFADSQKHTLAKFGVDTTVVTELNADLLRQYCMVQQVLLKQWMARIQEVDSKEEAVLQEGLGQCTHWPGDLMACVGEQVALSVKVSW